jgi:streptogrisin C
VRIKSVAVVSAALCAVSVGLVAGERSVSAAQFMTSMHVTSVRGYAGKCITVDGQHPADGAQLVMHSCANGSPNQGWGLTGGQLVNPSWSGEPDRCMDVAWGSTANGATVQLASCNRGPAQQWVLTAAGDLVNPQADKCVDVKDWNTSEGAPLQLWDCHGGANQKWSR